METKETTLDSTDLKLGICGFCAKKILPKLPQGATSCRCRSILYCNDTCSKANWKQHAQEGCEFIQQKLSLWSNYKQQKAVCEADAREGVLSSVVSQLNYPEFLKDIKRAELACSQPKFFKIFEIIKRKHALAKGDRSYPALQLIDSYKGSFTYPGNEEETKK